MTPDDDDRVPARAAGEPLTSGMIVPLDDLEHTRHAHELVGADYGDLPFCEGFVPA